MYNFLNDLAQTSLAVVIFSDSLSALQSIKHNKLSSREDIVKEIVVVIHQLITHARKEEKLRKQKENIIHCVTHQGGLCQSTDDIIRLLQAQKIKAEKMKASKMQIDYEKIVLGSSSPKLKRTKVAISDLAKNSICFKFDQETADRLEAAVQAACVTQGKQTRQDLAEVIDSSSDSDTDSSPEEEVIYPPPTEGSDFEFEEFVEDFSFSFTHQGQTVAFFFL